MYEILISVGVFYVLKGGRGVPVCERKWVVLLRSECVFVYIYACVCLRCRRKWLALVGFADTIDSDRYMAN